MFRSLFVGTLGVAALGVSAFADTVSVSRPSYPYVLSATADTHSYGLWLTAPASGARAVRYIVVLDQARLGASPPLRPGEGAVIRIGRGFAEGDHALAITCIGCEVAPPKARRVILGRSSPDHSGLFK
jgi:hypothetical protein